MSTPVITCITTCKGRLPHLQQSLPAVTAQTGVQAVVVDYGCPQGAGQWVNQHHGTAQVLRIDDDPGFHAARARNAGAALATTPWLFFMDADVVVAPDFFARIIPMLKPEGYYLASPATPSTWGSCLLPTAVFRHLGGYDEAIHGYGGEDNDLYERLDHAGLRRSWFPIAWLRPLDHDDEERTRYHDQKDLDHVTRMNHLYRIIKLDMMRLAGRMPTMEQRLELRKLVDDAVRRSQHGPVSLRVPLPARLLKTRPARADKDRPRLRSTLRYELAPPDKT